MRRFGMWFAGAMALASMASCGVADDSGDAADDPFLVDGKADVSGIADGSDTACGVLSLVNGASLKTLDKDAKLAKNAAEKILAHRAGADGLDGTADDDRFDDLAELDAVKYVGPKAFDKLVDYATDHGFLCQFPAVDLQLVSFSDWHGQLDPLSIAGVNVGGAAVLSTRFAADRVLNPNTLTLTAGDAFGATPPLSSFFEERPSVLALNAMGLSADGLGNHNFDRGVEHLETMIELADYPFLSANLENVDENMTCPSKPDARCVEPYRIFTVGGVKVAVVAVTNPDAEGLTKPGSFGTIHVTDPLTAALDARSAAAAEGAQVFVLMAHMGATALLPDGTPTGPLVDLANMVTGFDVILGDHTNVLVNRTIGGALVVENLSAGASYARVRIQVKNKWSHEVLSKSAESIQPTAAGIAQDPAIVALLAPYRTQLAMQFDGTIGTATGIFERGMNVERLREMPIGDLIADSMRLRYGTQIALTNGGGIRAPFPSSYAPMNLGLRRPAPGYAAGPPYDLLVGDVFTVLPFGNSVSTRTVSGAQLWAALEHSVSALPAANGWFAQISGFRFTFNSTLPAGSRVLSVTLDDGTPILADETRYTMATSDFIDVGGDGYTMFAGGDGVTRDKMADVLLAYIQSLGTLNPTTSGRIVDVAAP